MTDRITFKGGPLLDHPGWWMIEMWKENDAGDTREFVRKEDGTYWHVAATDLFPRSGGTTRGTLGDEIMDDKRLDLCREFYTQLKKKTEENPPEAGSRVLFVGRRLRFRVDSCNVIAARFHLEAAMSSRLKVENLIEAINRAADHAAIDAVFINVTWRRIANIVTVNEQGNVIGTVADCSLNCYDDVRHRNLRYIFDGHNRVRDSDIPRLLLVGLTFARNLLIAACFGNFGQALAYGYSLVGRSSIMVRRQSRAGSMPDRCRPRAGKRDAEPAVDMPMPMPPELPVNLVILRRVSHWNLPIAANGSRCSKRRKKQQIPYRN